MQTIILIEKNLHVVYTVYRHALERAVIGGKSK